MRFYRLLAILSSGLLLGGSAQAQDSATSDGSGSTTRYDDGYGGDPTEPLKFAFERFAGAPVRTEKALANEFNLRLRFVSVPRFVLDNWFVDDDSPDWAYVEPRPRIGGVGLGFEYVVQTPHDSGIFYVEYVDSLMKGGYWDDYDAPTDSLDGDYINPGAGTGIVGAGVNYAYEAPLVKRDETGSRFSMGLVFGGGLGIGVLVGKLDQWGPDALGNPSYKRFADGEPPDNTRKIPRVWPLVDVNAGFRFRFGERFVLRTEGGLHTAFFAGASAGVTF